MNSLKAFINKFTKTIHKKTSNTQPKDANNKGLAHFAFTLAETLITLTIIGVIAAMTIPTLLSKYQSHVQLTALKKAYSNLQNAIKMLPISLNCGTDYNCVWDETDVSTGDSDQKFNKAMAKQFKYTEIDEYTNFIISDEEYGNYSMNWGYFVTPDGMTWGMHYINSEYIHIWVDTTGIAKGPNKRGKDVFQFDIATNSQNGIPAGTVMPSGSKISSEYFNNDAQYWRNNDDNWYLTGKVLELDKIDE